MRTYFLPADRVSQTPKTYNESTPIRSTLKVLPFTSPRPTHQSPSFHVLPSNLFSSPYISPPTPPPPITFHFTGTWCNGNTSVLVRKSQTVPNTAPLDPCRQSYSETADFCHQVNSAATLEKLFVDAHQVQRMRVRVSLCPIFLGFCGVW